MPSKKTSRSRRRAPRAPKKKLYKHTFYLLQPFLQFFALVAILVIFTRCSPLAPSTNKESGAPMSPATPEAGIAQVLATAEEEAIQKNMLALSESTLSFTAESNVDKLAGKALNAERPFSEVDVAKTIKKKSGLLSSAKILLLTLPKQQQDALLNHGHIRIDLSSLLEQQPRKAKKELFLHLAEAAKNQDLVAKLYVALPDAVFQQGGAELKDALFPLRASFSNPADEKAFLEIHTDSTLLLSDNGLDDASLLKEALQESLGLAILLE